MAIISYARNSNYKLTLHFAKHEFDCKCGCRTTKHDEALSKGLEELRTIIGSPITITSGYRCYTRNKAVGGTSGSRHVSGQAADIKSKIDPVALGMLASEHFKGVGIYWYGSTAFVHVDTRARKATWLCDKAGDYHYTSGQSFILPTVRKGSTDKAAVKMLQRLLGIAPDGVFGSGTDKALRATQRAHGITVDGVCGKVSWRHISGANKYC